MNEIARLTAWHKAQLGTAEKPKGSNNVVYNTYYYGQEVSGVNVPWCCAYIWCSFEMNGLSHLFCGGAKTAYCPFVVDYAEKHNQWITDGKYTEGDLLLYDWDGDGVADHIGYCISSNASTVTAIEGNAGDEVSLQTRSKYTVMGAYRPSYAPAAAVPAPEPAWATAAMDNLFSLGIVHGDNGTRDSLRPNDNITRAEVFVLMDNLRKYFKEIYEQM